MSNSNKPESHRPADPSTSFRIEPSILAVCSSSFSSTIRRQPYSEEKMKRGRTESMDSATVKLVRQKARKALISYNEARAQERRSEDIKISAERPSADLCRTPPQNIGSPMASTSGPTDVCGTPQQNTGSPMASTSGSTDVCRTPQQNTGSPMPSPSRPRPAVPESQGPVTIPQEFPMDTALPSFKVDNDEIKRITPATLDDVISGKYKDAIIFHEIIDCRTPDECLEGTISDVLYLETRIDADDFLFSLDALDFRKARVLKSRGRPIRNLLLIFYDETSALQGPAAKMASYVRKLDRQLHSDEHQGLHYPEIYVLEGGFKVYSELSPKNCKGPRVRSVPKKEPEGENDKVDSDSDSDETLFNVKVRDGYIKRKNH